MDKNAKTINVTNFINLNDQIVSEMLGISLKEWLIIADDPDFEFFSSSDKKTISTTFYSGDKLKVVTLNVDELNKIKCSYKYRSTYPPNSIEYEKSACKFGNIFTNKLQN
jgi:hypothetical protein